MSLGLLELRQDAEQQHRQLEQLGGNKVDAKPRLRVEEQKEQLRDFEEHNIDDNYILYII